MGRWLYGLSPYTLTMRPYIVYDHRSFEVFGGSATATANTTTIAATTGRGPRRGDRRSRIASAAHPAVATPTTATVTGEWR